MIKIYDTMTRSLRDFVPIHRDTVNMYVCGPTVYNYIHIGNARSAVVFDSIRRYFEYAGYKVNYISNFTDVDDKIIKAAKQAGMTPKDLADKFIAAFMEDTKALGIKSATKNPRVVEYMDQIINFVQILINKGFAYESAGDVYFRVQKSQNYAALANKTLDELEIGASGRTDSETELKEDPLDFALWKSAKPGEVSWDSPWGQGRPGWHIECSVMSTAILGDTIDIHGGGADLEFPHHTNEIAQSEAKTGKTFANYWMHNGFVNVDNEKMSKSLGNFVTVHDLLKTVNGQVLRFFLATQHYRRPINFTEKAIHDAEVNLKYLKNTFTLPINEETDQDQVALDRFLADFKASMDDDFNTANGITVVFEMAKWINSNSGHYTQAVKESFAKMLDVFGIVFEEEVLDADIEKLIEERQAARANKDFARADRIRDDLAAQGIKLLDTKDSVRWTRDQSSGN
ncbi:cysteine--tRNA ligase [Streptococcus dentapri]|uniref:Cysteine--tRNA ligase n=1 Tax=Streptococcus dentapri TaxID=573564 RepID=A0ABV8D254_9STRE